MGPESTPIERPIFIVGMPRSGTTVIHETLAARSDVAWFSRPLNRVPRFPVITVLERLATLHPSLRSTINRSDQIGPGLRRLRRLERVRLGPTEGTKVWRTWFGNAILYDFLLGVEATESQRERARAMVSKLLRYQGGSRLVAKLTGPGHVRYLSSYFPDAQFIHVIRDGRAVVHSLMNFPAWRDTFRLHEPAWRNGVSDAELSGWKRAGGSPLVLAAIEWRTVVEATRGEAAELGSHRYTEVRYEDFLGDPHSTLDRLTGFCGLEISGEAHAYLDRRVRLRDMNHRWRERLTADEVQTIEAKAGALLSDLGYRH